MFHFEIYYCQEFKCTMAEVRHFRGYGYHFESFHIASKGGIGNYQSCEGSNIQLIHLDVVRTQTATVPRSVTSCQRLLELIKSRYFFIVMQVTRTEHHYSTGTASRIIARTWYHVWPILKIPCVFFRNVVFRQTKEQINKYQNITFVVWLT